MKTSLDKNHPLREKIAKVELSAQERLSELERYRKEKKKKEEVATII